MGVERHGRGRARFCLSSPPLPGSPSRQRDGMTPSLPHKGGGNKQVFLRRQYLVLLSAVLLACLAATARAEVQKFLKPCGQQLCPSYQLVLTPPEGWEIDKQASRQNKIQIMVPNGASFATAEPLIYVEVFYHRDKQQTLADFARVSNARWVAANAKAKISELPAVERSNGKPPFIRFAFDNPDKAQQAYEIGAFGIDSDKDGNEFVLDVVMSGSSKEALNRADAAYVTILKAH